jgi:hypothetical protein
VNDGVGTAPAGLEWWQRPERPHPSHSPGGAATMADLVYVLLTLAVFAVLALVLAGTERM